MHTRMLGDYGGVVNTMPKFAALMMLFAMANSGLPATSGFVGEFLVIMGAMKVSFWLAFLAAMFFCVGVLYDRMHTRNIADYGGVVNTMPKFAALMMLFAMANCGLPATSGFVGEFMVIVGAMKFNFWIAFLAGTTLVF